MAHLRKPARRSLPAISLSVSLGASMGVLAIPSALPAQALGPVAIQVRGPANQAVPSKISVRRDGVEQSVSIETDANGNRTLPDMPCEPRLEFKAKPNSGYFLGSGTWKACNASPLVLPVRQNGVSFQAANAFSLAYPTAMAARRDALRDALASGDARTASESAYALTVYWRQQGREDLAKDMAAVVIDQSMSTIAAAGVDTPDQAVRFDKTQGAYVATPEAEDALAKYQTKVGIRSATTAGKPQWDLRTMDALVSSTTTGSRP